MNSKSISWFTVKMILIWFLSVFVGNRVLGGDTELVYQSIMIGGLLSAVSTILLLVGILAPVWVRWYWALVNVAWLLAINSYMWLIPLVPDLMTSWAWYGVATLSFASVTTLYEMGERTCRVGRLNIDKRKT